MIKLRELREIAPLGVWGLSLVFIFLILAISNLVEMWVEGTRMGHPHLYLGTSVGVLFGALSFWLVAYLHEKKKFFSFFEVFRRAPKKKDLAVVLVSSLIFATVLSLLTERDFRIALKEPGWIFALVFAVFTVVGLWLSFDAILEAGRVIRSFPKLYERMLDLVTDTKDHPKYGPLRILAYTPAIGFLALPDRWKTLREELTKLPNRLEIVCLDYEDLSYWHDQYIGRPRPGGSQSLSDQDTKLATSVSEKLLSDELCPMKVARKKHEMMPGFYLIFNDVRAIVVAPFFIPFPIGTPPDVQMHADKVQMLGFETTDERTIEEVKTFFNQYLDPKKIPNAPWYFDSQVGDISKVSKRITAQSEILKQTTTTPATTPSNPPLFRYRLSVVEAAPGEKATL